MNSIIYIIGSFLAVLVASISCHANYYIINDPVTSYIPYPFYFVYDKNKDFLLMDITVKVKPSVTAVYVIYQSGTIPLKTKVFTDTKTAEAKTFISKRLMNNFTFIDVELRNQTAVCTTTRVAKGYDMGQLGNWNYKKYDKTNKLLYYIYNKVRYYETSNCLAPYPCGIFVNLTNQDCEERKEFQPQKKTSNSQNNWLIYFFATAIGISILMLLIYMIFKKRWCTKSRAVEETVELDNNVHQNQVLYADLDHVNSAYPAQRQYEESHYANIAGVLHPL